MSFLANGELSMAGATNSLSALTANHWALIGLSALILFASPVMASNCSSADITLNSQAAINNFQATYGGGGICDTVTQTLWIEGGDISSLLPLTDLVTIGLNLYIFNNPNLTNLDGLSSLSYVGNALQIQDNSALVDLDGLLALTVVSGNGGPANSGNGGVDGIALIDNGALANVDGLSNLTSAGGILVQNNDSLSDLDSLLGISGPIGGGLWVNGNEALISLAGLSNITQVEGWGGRYMAIGDNPVLQSLYGLHNITSVSTVYIMQNNSLTDLDGLNSLTHVDDIFIVEGGEDLASLNGLQFLNSVGCYFGINTYGTSVLMDLSALQSLTSVGADRPYCESYSSGLNLAGDAIVSLHGLENLVELPGKLTLWRTTGLANLDGLAQLTTLGGLEISGGSGLETLGALSSLESITADLTIGDYQNSALDHTTKLVDLEGLSNLKSVGGNVRINSQKSLQNVNALSSLSYVGGQFVMAIPNGPSRANPILDECAALAVLFGWPNGPPQDLVEGGIEIQNNAPGCNSVEEILASVSGPTAPSITDAEGSNGQAMLTFLPATTADSFWTITGYRAHCLSDNQYVFQNNTITAIPDNSSVDSSLSMSGVPFKNSAGLRVSVNITHPRTRHLTLILTSPTGTSVKLWDEAVGTGSDLVGTFPTTLEPAESLDAFDGLNFNGEWHLTVADGVASFTGTLNSWGIAARGEVTATSETSPVALVGLADSQAHSCTVSAITGLGLGPASNIVSVTPTPELIFDNGFEE